MTNKLKNLAEASIGPVWGPWLVFFISFSAYLATMAPTIGPIDSGELSLACKTLGIAHPTGYPLYTLIGRLWVSLFPFGELAWRLNLLSLILTAFSASWLCRLLAEWGIRAEISFPSSLIYAFLPVIWQQSVFLEVYALTACLSMILIWLALRFDARREARYFMLGAFVAGLGLGNHMSWLWLLPGFLLLALDRAAAFQLRIWFFGSLFFALGLSVYLFLPVRASLAPLFNWGDPSDWERFFWHISGRQYRVWMFSGSAGEWWFNLKRFFAIWLDNPPPYLWWLVVPGGLAILHKSRRRLFSLLAIMLLTVIYAVNYSIPDIEAYYIPVLICSSIFLASGLALVHDRFKAKLPHRRSGVALTAAVMVLPIFPLLSGLGANDNSRNRLSYVLADGILESAAPNAVILADSWDLYSPCLYLLHYQGMRPDVILIDLELLRRSWYYDYLERCYPDFYGSCRDDIERFKKQLWLFEHDRPYDRQEIQKEFIGMINAFLLTNYYDQPPYLTQNKLEGDLAGIAVDYQRVPEGLLYRLRLPGKAEMASDSFMFSGQLLELDTLKLSLRERFLYRRMPQMLYQRGMYLAQNLLFDQALDYFLQALRYERNKAALYLAVGSAYTGLNRLEEARDAFQKALLLEPGHPVALENLRRISVFLPGGPKALTTEIGGHP